MSFVGFIVKRKDEKKFENKIKNITKQCPISINEKSIFNIKNIHFETLIIDRNIKEGFDMELDEIIKTAQYLIINHDRADISKIKNASLTIITYGFGNKSTITASSIEADNPLICLQRCIKRTDGKLIEPQEINLNENIEDSYLKMALGAVKLLYR